MAVEDSWYTVDKDTGKKIKTKRYGRGKRWRVRNRGARTVSFVKKADAEAHDTAVKAELLAGRVPFDRTAGRVKFKDYAEKWLREHHYTGGSRDTVRSRIDTHLIPAFGEKRMCDIRPSTITAWLADLRTAPSRRTKRPLAPRTVAFVYDALAGILSAAVVDKVLGENPMTGLEYPAPPKRRRVLQVWEQDTVDAVLAGLDERNHAIGLLAATVGLRQGEAFAVGKGDIGWFRKEITVRHQVQRVDGRLTLVPPKGGTVRTVPIGEVTSTTLAEQIRKYGTVTVTCECHGEPVEVLFHRRGALLADQQWNTDVWHPAVRAADLTPSRSTGLHQLRHAYASMLIDGGATPKQVQEYLGHASITITMDIYGHLFERSHDRARSIVDAAFSGNVARRLSSVASAGAYPVRTQHDQ